jgi:hypothetical protein
MLDSNYWKKKKKKKRKRSKFFWVNLLRLKYQLGYITQTKGFLKTTNGQTYFGDDTFELKRNDPTETFRNGSIKTVLDYLKLVKVVSGRLRNRERRIRLSTWPKVLKNFCYE